MAESADQETSDESDQTLLGSDDETSAFGDLTGRTFDDFRVLRKLGAGGMASVYLADQMSLGRRVAIKLMSPSVSDDATAAQRSLARFRTEAMAAAALTHPNIVQVYTVGESDGLPYIAMEYVPGRNLSQLVRRQGPLEIRLALHVIRQSARALSAAHAAGVIHRDIKPANILVSPKGDVKVADFGLSQLTSGPLASPGLTQTGTTVGTPRYMSPEQIEGKNVDARSDIYSLGVTLFYVLAGRAPFDSPSPMVLASQHLRDEPPSVSDFRPDAPGEIVELLTLMLEKNPENRIESADEVVRQLGFIASNLKNESGSGEHAEITQVSAARPSATQPIRKKATESQPTGRWAGATVAFLAAAIGFGSAGLMQTVDPLEKSVAIERAGTARDQFVAAMLSGDPAAFRAVETYWPQETRWVHKAKGQRLLSALADPRRSAEARTLIDDFSSIRDDAKYPLIAKVADVVLLSYEGKTEPAKAKLNPRLMADAESTLDPVWVGLLSEAQRLIEDQ